MDKDVGQKFYIVLVTDVLQTSAIITNDYLPAVEKYKISVWEYKLEMLDVRIMSWYFVRTWKVKDQEMLNGWKKWIMNQNVNL